MKFSARTLLSALIFFTAVFSFMFCGNDSADVKTAVIEEADPYLNHGDSAHYVGMEKCQLCHQDIYNSFIQTGMGKSFEHASKKKSSAKFDKHTVIYDKYSDYYYHPFWEG